MTDKALSAFEGSDVVAAKIEIPDAGGGLRDALSVEPVELSMHDEVHIVLRCRVKKIRFDPVDKATAKRTGENSLARVHVFETIDAAFIDADIVAQHLNENVDRVKREVERLAGVQRLDDALEDDEQDELDAENEAAMIQAHASGLHPHTVVSGCPTCAQREDDRAADQRQRADLS